MVRPALFVVTIVVMVVSAIVGVAATSDMAARINDRLPLDQRRPFDSWSRFADLTGYPRDRSLFREYRRLYPVGPLAKRALVCFAVAGVAVIAAGALAGIIP